MAQTLRLILGDQLNINHSWYRYADPDVTYVMMEMRQETDQTKLHIQKITGFFAAMRDFAKELRSLGHQVEYLRLDDPLNDQKLDENLFRYINELKIELFEYQLPDEYRLDRQLKDFCRKIRRIRSQAWDTEHFFTRRLDVKNFFGEKNWLMESFYRHMRRKNNYLMAGDKPIGGKWNFDVSNRKKLPKGQTVVTGWHAARDVTDIVNMIKRERVAYFGNIKSNKFDWPANRAESIHMLDYFVSYALPHFGTFQDAMSEDHWLLFHSRLSFSLNTKMISPKEVIDKAIEVWEKNSHKISLAQIEGFVRQILGWREYMRGVYWAHMPGFAQLNELKHHRQLPEWFWNGKTRMQCLKSAINNSLDKAYAHHIQRLMVTGNFMLLAGIDPDEADNWYMGIYIDAIEWVEMPNTRGMSQYADGGIVGSKPYVSSANYINKMSDHCSGCFYDHKKKYGEKSCPFNSFYWHFISRNREKLAGNPRMSLPYRLYDKTSAEEKEKILNQAAQYLDKIEEL